MEKTEACAILRIPIEASRSEVETAFRKRMREVRTRFDAARGMSLRAQYQREFAAIRDAQDCLLSEIKEIGAEQPTIREPLVDGPKVEDAHVDEPPVDGPGVGESRPHEHRSHQPQTSKSRTHEPQSHKSPVNARQVTAPEVEDPRVDEIPVDAPQVDGAPFDRPQLEEPRVDRARAEAPPVDELPAEGPAALEQSVTLLGREPNEKSPQPTVSIPEPLKPGQLFLSRFELQRELEIGSTGALWLAQDHASQRQVALLFLPRSIMSDKAGIDNLRNEIRRRAKLNHPNILQVFDLLEDKGRIAIEIESPVGRSLSELRLGKPNHVFEVEDLQAWLKQLCEALQYAHAEAGLIHGNIQPANLIVDRTGSLKVKDFGISNCVSESISRLAGTPKTSEALQYKSPRQAAGEPASVVDDLYSLGATLYESLTSKPPFSAREIALQVSSKKPPSMTERRAQLGIQGGDIPKSWEEAVAACLETDPSHRPQSAIEVARRLENALPPLTIPDAANAAAPPAPLPPPVPPAPPTLPPVNLGNSTHTKPPSSVRPPSSRKRWLVIGGLLLILVGVLATVFLVFHFQPGPKRGRLVVKTSPLEAKIFLDGVERGKTPLVLEDVAPGDRRLRIELPGYRKEELIVPIKQGGPDGSLLIHLAPLRQPSPPSTVTASPSGSGTSESSPSLPTPSTEGSQTPSSNASETASPEPSGTVAPEPNVTAFSEPSATTSPQQGVSPNEDQSSSATPTPLSQQQIDSTKGEVIRRIDALPNVSPAAKKRLIEKLDRARSMVRLTVIPFDAGRTVLHREAADALVQTFDSPAIRDKLSDPTIVLVVAGYADHGGRADLNLRISRERAEHVTRTLKQRANLLNAMETIGMGGSELLDSNRPDQNRAVEVWAVVPY